MAYCEEGGADILGNVYVFEANIAFWHMQFPRNFLCLPDLCAKLKKIFFVS